MHAPAATARQTMSLRQLIAMSESASPWTFIPLARQALPQTGHDPELWFQLASNLADLGLVTLARRELDALCERRPAAARAPIVRTLQGRLDSLPDDRLDPATCLARVEQAVDALKARGIDLSEAHTRWLDAARNTMWYAATGGSVVRETPAGLELLGDHRQHAKTFAETHLTRADQSRAPITIEGVDPPWLLLEIAQRTAKSPTGYQPGIRIIQADTQEFLDGCALADLSPIFSEERTELFLGEEAHDELNRALTRDAGSAITGPYIPLTTLRTPMTPSTQSVFESALRTQDVRHRSNLRTIHDRDGARTTDFWRTRIAHALSGDDEPLRVLLTASRFTTVLHSMCEDLASALQERGCETLLLTEPSPHRKLTPLAYSEALASFDPDLILAPNHTRSDLERVITGTEAPEPDARVLPAGVPFVLWLQDSMPHLLSTKAGASVGELDIAMGYVTRTMIDTFGYPEESVLPAQLVASERRFRPAAPSPDFACDVAMMTHHSETPDALWSRLLDEMSADPALCRQLESIRPELDRLAAHVMDSPGTYLPVRELFGALAMDPERREVLTENVGIRYIDRTLRHEAAHWARAICERRGWTFRLYGRGWEDHPALGDHAMGEIPHDDALASAYANAGLVLHVSAFNSLHQRLIECALAGGAPVIRLTRDALTTCRHGARMRVLRDHTPIEITRPDEFGAVKWFDHITSRQTARLTDLDRFFGGIIKERLALRCPDEDPRQKPTNPRQLEADADWLLGDVFDNSFDSESSLERLIERSRNYPNWKESYAGGITRRAGSHFTHEALAAQLLEKARQRIA